MSCIIGFGTNSHWTSWLIRKIIRGEYSHSWIELDCDGLGRMALHASSIRVGMRTVHGVAVVPDFVVHKNYPVKKRYSIDHDLSSGLIWARSMVGAGYDFGVIWNGLLLLLLRLTGWKWLERYVVRNASIVSCSELISSIVRKSRVRGSDIIDPELTTSSGSNLVTISLETWCAKSGLCKELEDV